MPDETVFGRYADQTPMLRLHNLITGSWVSQAVYVAAELGIADLLANGARGGAEIAAAVGAHPPSMQRFLRALTTIDICQERPDGSFELTEVGQLLRSDHAESLRSFSLFAVDALWPIWGHLLDSVRTGQSAREILTGKKDFEHLAGDPRSAALFNQSMAELTRLIAGGLLRSYDFSGLRRIVDVGGGSGQLLATVLQAYPDAQGVLFDMPHAYGMGKARLAEADLTERCEVVSGSFFDQVPGQGDVYLLKSILHDWTDARCQQILQNISKAMHPASRLLVIERIYPDHLEVNPAHQIIARSDLNMLVGPGGRERTETEMKELLRGTGFDVRRIIPLDLMFSLIEAVTGS